MRRSSPSPRHAGTIIAVAVMVVLLATPAGVFAQSPAATDSGAAGTPTPTAPSPAPHSPDAPLREDDPTSASPPAAAAGADTAGVGGELLDRVRGLAAAEAPRLALDLLETGAPDPARTRQWLAWERERLRLYFMLGDWRGIAGRVQSIPPEVPVQFADEVRTQAAEALIELGEGAAARRQLRWLIWNSLGDATRTAHWRRLVLRSYLGESNLRDARITARRYEQEFRPADSDWTRLHARIALAAGDVVAASQMLATDQSPRGRLLRLVARLRGDIYSPQEVIERARAIEAQRRADDGDMEHELWALIAQAAAAGNDNALRVEALERAVAVDPGVAEWTGLLRASVDELWNAYLALARDLGNEANLLRGDPGPWLALAQARAEAAPLEARAIHAMLVATADGAEAQADAAHQFVSSLAEAGYPELVITLFTGTERFPEPAALPAPIRYVVADRAVTLGDMAFASTLLEGLEEPPAGVDAMQWSLRRARVEIYAGRFEEGASILRDLLESVPALDQERGTAVLEVLFDLQAVGRYQEAVGLFERVYRKTESAQHRREALFWMAECHAQLGDQALAAEQYLRAARLAPEPHDMWDQTARYRAADALAKAGFTGDARRVYESLLRVAGEPRRRAVLQRRLQELWLLEQGNGDTTR